jgi:hypothetical protein
MKSEEEIMAILAELREKQDEIDEIIYSHRNNPCIDATYVHQIEGAKIEGQIHALRWVLQNAMV